MLGVGPSHGAGPHFRNIWHTAQKSTFLPHAFILELQGLQPRTQDPAPRSPAVNVSMVNSIG